MTESFDQGVKPLPPVPSTEGAAPDSGLEFTPPPEVCELMRDVAAKRGLGWRICVELFSAPSVESVERLRDGSVLEDLKAAVEWLGDDSARFMPTQMILDTFARRSRRHTLEADLQDISSEYRGLWPEGVPWLAHFEHLAKSCDEEARAWEGQRYEEAKKLRVTQKDYLEENLNDNLPPWAGELDVSTTKMIYRTAARYAVAYLSFESGRDFDRVIFGDSSYLSFDND